MTDTNLIYPYEFKGGKKAVASEVNANFEAVKTFANGISVSLNEIHQAISDIKNKPTREMFDVSSRPLKFLEQERLINASWAEKNIDYKVYNLSLIANQTDDIITKITQTISHLNYNIIGLETKFASSKLICNVKIKLPKNADADKLDKLLLKLDNILEVKKI